MNSIPSLLRYLQTWLPGLPWLRTLGLLLLVATPLALLFFDRSGAFTLSLYAYGALALPYLVAWYPFRLLLSNRRLALLPGFHVKAGLAALLFTAFVALYPPFSASLFAPGLLSWELAPRIFYLCSFGFWLLQWLCTTRFMSAVVSGITMLAILALQFREALLPRLAPLMQKIPGLDLALFMLALLLWFLALRLLARDKAYAPPWKRQRVNTTASTVNGASLWNNIRPSEAALVLLNYPNRDRWVYGFVVFGAFIPMLVGLTYRGEPRSPAYFSYTFLFMFFMMGTSFTERFINELVTKSRFLWLRRGGGRSEHWRFLEAILLRNFIAMGLWLILALLLILVTPLASRVRPADFLPIAWAYFVICTYGMAAVRAANGPWYGYGLLCIVLFGVIIAALSPSMPPILTMCLTLALIPLLRALAKYYFLRIDWHLVQPKKPKYWFDWDKS
jgi:hypothetical protein